MPSARPPTGIINLIPGALALALRFFNYCTPPAWRGAQIWSAGCELKRLMARPICVEPHQFCHIVSRKVPPTPWRGGNLDDMRPLAAAKRRSSASICLRFAPFHAWALRYGAFYHLLCLENLYNIYFYTMAPPKLLQTDVGFRTLGSWLFFLVLSQFKVFKN